MFESSVSDTDTVASDGPPFDAVIRYLTDSPATAWNPESGDNAPDDGTADTAFVTPRSALRCTVAGASVNSSTPQGAVLTNQAQVSSSDSTDPGPTANTFDAPATVQRKADLGVTNAVSAAPSSGALSPDSGFQAVAGESVKYLITASNGGPSDATVSVSDTLHRTLFPRRCRCVTGMERAVICDRHRWCGHRGVWRFAHRDRPRVLEVVPGDGVGAVKRGEELHPHESGAGVEHRLD